MMQDLNLIKLSALAVGARLPNDSFFEDGNTFVTHIKKYGIYETDSEDLLHEPVTLFCCQLLGCNKKFDTVFQFEQHYNSNHRYACGTCKKSITSPHLLDLHICESHDSYFAVQSTKNPMFRCYLEECSGVFVSALIRKQHCIEDHSFPSNFFNDKLSMSGLQQTSNGKNKKETNKRAKKKDDFKKMEIDPLVTAPKAESLDEKPKKSTEILKGGVKTPKPILKDQLEKMEIPVTSTRHQNKCLGPGNRQQRRRIFVSFEKDMADSLPTLDSADTK